MPIRELPAEIDERLRKVSHRFAAQGSELSLTDVASDIGVPRATLYYHFSGRDDLLAHLVRNIVDENRSVINEAVKGYSSPPEGFAAIVDAQIQFLTSNSGTTRALFTNLGRFGDLREIAQHTQEAFHNPMTEVLEAGVACGDFRPGLDIETVVSALFGAITMTVMHYVVVDTTAQADRISETLLPFLTAGLR